MPYILTTDNRRQCLRNGEPALNAGELNYQIFYYIKHNYQTVFHKDTIKKFIDDFLGARPNYQRYNDMTGALIRCKKELERRLNIPEFVADSLLEFMEYYDLEIAKYEDLKILENGDVE
ncbi:MAG TPA: hypothetical protein VGB37_10020 [Candidatus Lokiarchaeia archaeon]